MNEMMQNNVAESEKRKNSLIKNEKLEDIKMAIRFKEVEFILNRSRNWMKI